MALLAKHHGECEVLIGRENNLRPCGALVTLVPKIFGPAGLGAAIWRR